MDPQTINNDYQLGLGSTLYKNKGVYVGLSGLSGFSNHLWQLKNWAESYVLK